MSDSALYARERILHTASNLFYREGIPAVGIDRMIAESGVAKSTLYKHFPFYDGAIVTAVMRHNRHVAADARAAAEAVLAAAQSGGQKSEAV